MKEGAGNFNPKHGCIHFLWPHYKNKKNGREPIWKVNKRQALAETLEWDIKTPEIFLWY